MISDSYLTGGGIRVHRTVEPIPMVNAIEPIVDALDARRGALLASSYEYPGRYTRWDMGFVDPPLALVARGRRLRVEALNRKHGDVPVLRVDPCARRLRDRPRQQQQ